MQTDLRPLINHCAKAWLGVVQQIGPSDWDRPALGTWTVKELVGHTLRAFTTIGTLLDSPSETATIDSATNYYRTVMSQPDIHVAVAARGADAGAALGSDPAAVATEVVETTLGRLATADLDAIGPTAAGTMRLGDYIGTRLVEIVVHLDDLCEALEVPTPDVGDAWGLVTGIAVSTASNPDARTATRALLGRGPLPDGFNLFG